MKLGIVDTLNEENGQTLPNHAVKSLGLGYIAQLFLSDTITLLKTMCLSMKTDFTEALTMSDVAIANTRYSQCSSSVLLFSRTVVECS